MPDIFDIRFIATLDAVHTSRDDDQRTRLGKVEIEYDDGQIDVFSNVDRNKYFRWINNGFSDDDMPAQIELREETENDELDNDNELVIRDDDYLGQSTGVASTGFVPIKIADDDYIGQVTGVPTQGHKLRIVDIPD